MAAKLHAVPSDVGPPAVAEPLSFESLYAEHFEFSWRVLHHLGLNGAALNDGCQELWLAVHRRLPTLELRCELRTWLFGIAINVARNHRRSEVRRGAVHELSVQLPCPAPDPEAQHSARETWSSVQGFLETLSETDRWIFVCNVVERLSAAETARALGIDVPSVYQRVRALKRAVQKWLER